ncbi:phage shock protein C, PspC [Bifidobacterium sp. DSM 109960]|uniref:Phage shock protein C, PspC n=1 Tax=Bifidobacterium erythrocebi TaxID=2675325 RepID=A0A7Y0HW95_9BIFI|nr:PspC domain-containing protein [Bifidobacterium sp. DSM 109960]NMM96694.1 phage shock protein C, PspC [Bifidobacterium sp. DSM 109960]
MSNAHNNPQDGWQDAGSAGPQSQPQPPMYQPQPNRGNRFFAWIRSSRITRGRNRWVAGVCDGVARRLGWNAALVRALVILTSLLFGAGAAFYALAWFLLPDETDGRILCEELINGHWDWNCAGALVCAAVALCLPGAGWLAFGVAVLVFWLLVNRQSYAASWQPPQSGGPWPGQPTQPGQPVQPAQSQYVPHSMPTDTAATADMSGMSGMAGQPMPQPTRTTSSGYQQYARPAQSPYQTVQQSVTPPAVFATSNVPPTFTAPPTVAVQPKRARRKPAGPLLVLVTLGLALLAVAGTGWYTTTVTVDWDYALRVLRLATLCCGGICLGIGVVIVVLGCMGRRTGGLHPLAWCAALMAVAMTFCTGAVTWESRDWMMSNDYHRTAVSGIVTWSDTSDAQMKRYEQGLVVAGKDYANDVLDIDLSGYPATHGKHKVKLNDGTYGESSCPAGELNLVVVNAQVVVTLPDGCHWSVSDPDSGYTNVTDYVGGPDGLTFFNGTGFVGLSLDENNDSRHGHHGTNKSVPALKGTTDANDSDANDNSHDSVYNGMDLDKAFATIYENKWYWPSVDSDKAPEEPDLFVNVDGTVGGSVTMQYASDSKLPLGTTDGQSHGSTDEKTGGKNAERKSTDGKETK